MKLLIFLIISFNYSITYAAISKRNSCENLKSFAAVKKIRLNSRNMETCFESAASLINNKKTEQMGIGLFAKFLYVGNDEYRKGAMLNLANSLSSKAIEPLLTKGKHAVNRNNKDDLEIIVTSLLTLNAHTASRELASYAKKKRKYSMMKAIGNEYLVYTNGSNFTKMEAIVGQIIE